MATNSSKRRRTLDAVVATRKPAAKTAPARRRLSDETVKEPDEQKPDEVQAVVPHDFTLTIDHHHSVKYHAGARTMPREHFDHWWSKANGVKDANATE